MTRPAAIPKGTAEIPCSHEHTEECHSLITRCVHAHTAECYTAESVSENADGLSEAENAAPTECVHACTEESGCILQTSDCKHAHDKDCGYAPASMGKPCTYLCEICDSKDGKTPMPLLGAARPAATQYTYTLHYDANGGSGAPPSQSVDSSEFHVWVPISEIIPTRDGYTFMGWANSRTGKPIYGGNGGYTSCLVVHGYDMSTTIYAIWEVHNHSWGEWTSNGNGTHTRTCITDSSHTETGNCSGGKATSTEKAHLTKPVIRPTESFCRSPKRSSPPRPSCPLRGTSAISTLIRILMAAKQRSRGRTSLFPARSASSTIGAAQYTWA